MLLLVALIMGGQLPGRAQRIPDTPNPDQTANQSAQNGTPKHESNGVVSWAIEHPDTFFAGVVALFTTVLAVSTVGLWIATLLIGGRQSREMRSHIEIARQSMIAAERAYISVRTVFFGRRPRSAEREFEGIDTGFTLRNTGNTFTKHMIAHFSMRIFNGEIPESFDFPDSAARGAEERIAWRQPIDLIALCQQAGRELPHLFAAGGNSSDWSDHVMLSDSLLGDDPAAIVDALTAAARDGASPADLGRALAYAAALRVARFGTANEHSDWETAHHVFTYANAVHQALNRIGGEATPVEAVRGLLHGAMSRISAWSRR
jgi:hypothetical protein